MEAVINWMNAWWWVVLIFVGVMVKLLNVTTRHWSDVNPTLGRVCLYLVDCLDVFKPTPKAPK